MNILLHPTYFPSVSHFVALAQAENITFEMDDNFQKQTNRNRMYIYSPNGLQMLNIPIKHSNDLHQKYKDVQIESAFNWQKIHFKSLEAAYRSSPFFEYFEDELMPVFEKKHNFLIDLNYETIEILKSCLGMKFQYDKTIEYFREPQAGITDFRYLANGKKDNTLFSEYTQVFGEKHGYLNNLSILDLLFNEGRYALDYLKEHTL
ncbi:WbqC family protein [Flavobacterium kingsejongi]|uniref:WbqC-like protein n=1 Tax=Flavobacterium kingsejongi TaxID=1678728 RepID=A0A2S1LP75_9FLAO|nr:WbqC family protein [Flavobacterium kingsejongi]AWG25471.1 hypothetical protein FK004_09600 [Flavobacterium kingsejongi]